MAGMDFRKLRNEYIRRSLRYSSAVRELYDQALKEISMEFSMLDYDPNLVFSFEKFGKFSDVDRIMTRLEQQIQQTINLAIENEFGAAYKAHENLLKQVLGSNVKKEVWQAFAPRISSGNAALLYMTETATDNITHSTRVWNGAVLGQMETAVQQAMMEGMPAKQMAGLIEQYLNDPDSCFRRFRIKTGVDADGRTMYGRKWKKRVRNKDGSTSWFDADPRDYPTGQGVYHSSYKNALRYTRSSTNIAYRTADFQRYQTEAFVLGFEIHTTSNPAHKEDICDFLAGRYPKEFKWVGWHPQCYSDDTEVYTKDGWKLFKDVKDDDLILSLNPQTRDLEYVPILLNISRPHKGKMVHFFNRSYSQLVTPEHDVLCVSKQDSRTFRRLKAEKCGVSQPIYRSSEWQGRKIESVSVGNLNVTFKLFAEFLGYWLSDGSLGHKWEINIAQTDDDRHRIFDCIKAMGMNPRYNGGLVSFNNKDWYDYLKQFGKAADKYVPQVIKDSNADGIKVFLDAFVSCDGYKKKPHSFVGNRGTLCQSKEEERLYFTSSKRMADDIGELILKIGRRPSFKVIHCSGKQQKFRNGIYTINNDHITISECRSQYATQYNKEFIDYDGMVYDLTLAKNNTLYIRRNGKCFWGSNCMCFQVPILATPEEVDAMADAIIKGQDPASVPVAGRVTDVPDNYKEWVAENEDRIQQSIDQGRQLPYFLRDNGSVVDGKYEMNVFGQPAPSTIDMARQRHQGRNNEMVADILSRNEERHERLLSYERLIKRSSNILKIANEYTEVDASKLNGLIKAVTSKHYYVPSEMDKLRSSLEDVKKAILQQKQLERELSDVIPDVHEWHKRFTIAELQSTKKAVEKRIADYERDYKGYRTLKNKMEFEANWVRDHKKYSTWEVAESAYRKKAIFYEENAAWSNIDGMISDAESYGHVSSIYDSLVSKAKSLRIAGGDKAYIESTLHGAELLREKYKDFDKRLAILKGFKTKSSDFKQLLNTAETFRSSDAPTQVIEEAIVEAEQRMASIMKRRGGSVSLGSFGKATLDDIKKKMGTNFPRSLEHLDDAIKKFTKTNPDFESSRDEIEKVLFDLFKDNDFGMDIDSDVLESVYKNGFYNQFQSGTSYGALFEPGKTTGKISTSNSRLIAAHKMFGLGDLSSNQLERHEYEKYGHLLDHDMLNAIKHNLTWYGNTQVRFKKDKVVCTWTFNDSLRCRYQPSLTTDPKIESLDFIPTEYKPKASDPKELFQWQQDKFTSYVELQFHGSLTIDDVESMVFKARPDTIISTDLIKRLIGKGIKLFYYEGGAVVEYIL